jgi:hypothetical protein
MKIITMIGLAAALCVPAAASAQRGDGAGAAGVQRMDQRIDTGRAIMTRDSGAIRGESLRDAVARDDILTGTRLQPGRPRIQRPERDEPSHSPARRRWNAANPGEPGHSPARRRWNAANSGEATHGPARRRWNAANPPAPPVSRPRGGR